MKILSFNIVIIILLIIAVFSSIVAWLNTQVILRDLSEIKTKLGIKEANKPSFLDKDLDND